MQRDEVLIGEMIDAAERAIEILGDLDAGSLEVDRVRRDAVLWNLMVLGEAATQVSEATKDAFPQVSWRPPGQLRNRIVHGYWAVDLDIIVAAVHQDLPQLLAELRSIPQS